MIGVNSDSLVINYAALCPTPTKWGALFPSPPPPNFSECEGLTTDEAIDDATIDRFSGCNIVTTGGIRIGNIAESNFK